MSDEKWDGPPEQDPFWHELEERNTGEFWKVEPGEHEEPTALEKVLDTVTIPAVTEKRSHRHRARGARRGRAWVSALVVAITAGSLGAVAWGSRQPYATSPTGNARTQVTHTVTVTPSPSVMPVPGPIVTKWRTRTKPGPTKTVTETPEPQVSVSTQRITEEPEIVVSVKPGPTVTVTVTEEADDGFPFPDGE